MEMLTRRDPEYTSSMKRASSMSVLSAEQQISPQQAMYLRTVSSEWLKQQANKD